MIGCAFQSAAHCRNRAAYSAAWDFRHIRRGFVPGFGMTADRCHRRWTSLAMMVVSGRVWRGRLVLASPWLSQSLATLEGFFTRMALGWCDGTLPESLGVFCRIGFPARPLWFRPEAGMMSDRRYLGWTSLAMMVVTGRVWRRRLVLASPWLVQSVVTIIFRRIGFPVHPSWFCPETGMTSDRCHLGWTSLGAMLVSGRVWCGRLVHGLSPWLSRLWATTEKSFTNVERTSHDTN